MSIPTMTTSYQVYIIHDRQRAVIQKDRNVVLVVVA
jgi:hypothetical protein